MVKLVVSNDLNDQRSQPDIRGLFVRSADPEHHDRNGEFHERCLHGANFLRCAKALNQLAWNDGEQVCLGE